MTWVCFIKININQIMLMRIQFGLHMELLGYNSRIKVRFNISLVERKYGNPDKQKSNIKQTYMDIYTSPMDIPKNTLRLCCNRLALNLNFE